MTKWLDENVIPEKRDDLYKTMTQCYDGNLGHYSNHTEWMGSYFKRGMDSFLYDAVPQSVWKASGIAGLRGRPTMPWYLYGVSQTHRTVELWAILIMVAADCV
jgi:hypothetical protein